MATHFKDLFSAATQSNHPLVAFVYPDFYLSGKYFKAQHTLVGLVQAIKCLPCLTWEETVEAPPPVGTLMATNLQEWVTTQDRPRPHPPNWRMDRVFRPRWTDPEHTAGQLEFIPVEERQIGYRSHPQLERNTEQGIFTAHPALQDAIDNIGPMSMEDDLATRLNSIVVKSSKNANL
ncbi:hypothetical protein BGZ80_008847, partial [Entomortierella chlamydospora]